MDKVIVMCDNRRIPVEFVRADFRADGQPANAMLAEVPVAILQPDGSWKEKWVELFAEIPLPDCETAEEEDELDIEVYGYDQLKSSIICQAIANGIDPGFLKFFYP